MDSIAETGVRREETQERSVAIPGAITSLVSDVTSLVKRVDALSDVLFPTVPNSEQFELAVLQRENRELRLSVYVLSGLLLLIFLVRR